MTGPGPPRDILQFQLAVLDAYERLLGSGGWDETRLNEALKSMMTSLLPLMRAQRALGEQLFDAHRGMLAQYRRTLEAALRQAGDGGAKSS